MTIFIRFAANCLILSKLTDGFDCESSTTSLIPKFERVFKRYSLTSLIATFSAAPSDSPKEDDIPDIGMRAPIVTVCCFNAVAGAGNISSEPALENGKNKEKDGSEYKEK